MKGRNIGKSWIGAALLTTFAISIASAQTPAATGELVKPNLPTKKLIEYGWDLPTPNYLHEHIGEMEKAPFEGVIFRLGDEGGQVFQPEKWDEKKLAPQLKTLGEIKWNKFTDNFLSVYAASTMDWFSDSDWDKVVAHTQFAAKAAKVAGCKGIMFDPEPYGNNPWNYSEQKDAKTKTFAQYAAQARKRGGQFMHALSSQNADLKVLMFYQYSMLYYVSHADDPLTRAQAVDSYSYGLMMPFLDGMLEAAGPGVQFIDGNDAAATHQTCANPDDSLRNRPASEIIYQDPRCG